MFLLLFLSFALPSHALDYENKSAITYRITGSGIIYYEEIGNTPSIEDFIFYAYMIPQEGDYIIDQLLVGNITFDDEGYKVFEIIKDNVNDDINYEVSLTVNNSRNITFLSELEPLSHVLYNDDIMNYTKYTNYTTPTSEMIMTASEIVQGAESKLEAVLRIASYVHDYINYTISLGDTIKDADWIFENKRGTCDEYSILAVSFLRSLKIPCRFVHGYAYSNVINDFGAHSWIEVYLNGKWIPFDPTYGQYGFIDVTHIPLKKTINAEFEISSAQYLRHNALMSASELVFNITPLSAQNQEIIFTTKTSLDTDKYYENDYAVLTVEINNPFDEYACFSVSIDSSLKKVYGEDYIILAPGSNKFYYIFKTSTIEEEGKYYIHPITINFPFGERARLTLNNYPGNQSKSFDDALKLIKGKELQEITNISLSVKDNYYYSLTPTLNVTVRNAGNMIVENLTVEIPEFELSEKINSLNINEEKRIPYNLDFSGFGDWNVTVNLIYDDLVIDSKTVHITLLKNVELEWDINYEPEDNIFRIYIAFEDLNKNNLHNSTITISSGKFNKTKNVKEYFLTVIPVEDIGSRIFIELVTHDISGREYKFFKSIKIEIGFWTKLKIIIKKFLNLFFRE